MEEHDLLTQLKSEIEPDLAPVRPLGAPSSRALWLLATWVVLMGGILAVFGPRQDIGVLGIWRSVGFSMIEVAFCFMLVIVSLRFSIPALAGSLSTALLWVAGALLVHFLISWATLGRSAVSPASGHEWRAGLACLSAITALSLAPLALAAFLMLRGLLMRPILAFVLAGLASGVGAEAAWRLHCTYSNWDHVLTFHSGALVLVPLVASVAAVFVGRSARSAR